VAALDIALDYIRRGWNPVPVGYRAKKPSAGNGWQLRIIDAINAPQYFNGRAKMNVGVILGPSSHGLTDVDLDCDEARAVAPYILPHTGAIFGRASSRAAHRLYYTDLSVSADQAVLVFNDPTTRGRILELRIGGASGAQTVFPGSTHESGEPITWEESGEPASVDNDDLFCLVHDVAAYALIARHWPAPGLKARHNAALIIGGLFARAGKDPQEINLAAEAIARAANDKEWRNRRAAAADAARAFHAGKHAHGLTSMRKQFGDAVADQVAEWLGYDGSGERQDSSTSKSDTAKDTKPAEQLIQSSAEFIASFECPDPLIEGIVMRKFIYALTGHVSKGKTAAALLFAAHIGLGKMLGNLEVEQGRVLYLAGENYVDIQMRWIAMAQQMDFDPATIPVFFRRGRLKLSGTMDQLRREVDQLGGVDFIVVDGSTAFFEGDDENSNAQAGAHAVRLRELTTLKGKPGVLVLCHPPKNAGDDNLQPRGAGAMIAEWDGNLIATKDGSVTTIHWLIKIRGPDFAPLSLLLRTVTHERLVSKTGKLMPTVVAEPLTEAGEEEMRKIARNEEDLVLEEIGNHPHSSQADIARQLGWLNQKGEIQKAKVHRIVKELKKQKLIEETRAGLSLTEKGNKAIKAKHGTTK
jgi:hypothetical protein